MRQYELKRVWIKKFGLKGRILVFDLWNNEQSTGYEVHLIVYHGINKAFRIAYDYIGKTFNINAWDELITCIKYDLIIEG